MYTTTKQKRLSGFISVALVLGVTVGLESQQPVPLVGQERPELSLEDEELLLRLNALLTEARELFDDPQRQSQSIEFLNEVVEDIENERRLREDVPEEIVNLQQQALELRARAFFNAGQLQGAADDFRQILLDNPRYSLDAESLSPRVIDFFEDQKKQLIGYIAVTTEPAGARVTVNDRFVGITNFFPIEVHTGIARLEVTLLGHESYIDEELRIEPGEITTLDLVLTRTSARLPIITDPPGVDVIVDGELAGKTSGTLPPDLRSFMPAQFDPSRLSAPFELGALPLGPHQIELRLDCYESVTFPFQAEEPRDYTAQIVKLEESIGNLTITSNPSDARVFLDGEFKGNTPLDLNRVCSGEHRLEVKHTTGKYVEDIEVGANESLSFECPIRPTMAVLGFVADESVPPRDLADIREKFETELGNLGVMNVVFVAPDVVSQHLGALSLEDFVPSAGGGATAPESLRDASERLGEALEVEALLVGYVPAQRLIKDVDLYLLAVGAPRPDRYSLNYLDPQAIPRFMEELSTPTRLFGSWAGMTSVDTRIMEGPIVLALDEGGPASQSGVEPGDIVISADGETITRSLDLLNAIRAVGPGETLRLGILRGGAPQEVSLAIGTTPLEIPMNREDFLYNKAIVDLRHRMVVDPSVENLARLNVGLCHMQLGDYETALKEYLPRVTLAETTGISQGTVYYYTALAYLRLGERAEAARLFQQAAGFERARLQSNDGPRVAPLAERRLREIGQ